MSNTINIYDTRTMMAAIEKMKPARTFFRDTFFNRVETYPTEMIDVDFKKGKRKMAPFVAPRVGGITIDRQGFITRTYTPPRVAPQRVLSKDDISKRMMGEAVYSRITPEQRSAEILGKDLAELDETITRREEWMCREILINGKVVMKGLIDDISGSYIEQEIDYNLTNKETLTEGAKWDAETSTKYDDLERWRKEVIKTSGYAPNVCIMASDVAKLFVQDTDIKSKFNMFNMMFGTIQPRIINDAVTYLGTLNGLGLEIYSYDEWFLDDAGVEQPMMPEKHLLLARVGMGKRIYGAVTQMTDAGEFATFEAERVPKIWADMENEVKMIKVSSRPLPAPEDIDDWYVAEVY